jgi:hypothetical protein
VERKRKSEKKKRKETETYKEKEKEQKQKKKKAERKMIFCFPVIILKAQFILKVTSLKCEMSKICKKCLYASEGVCNGRKVCMCVCVIECMSGCVCRRNCVCVSGYVYYMFMSVNEKD